MRDTLYRQMVYWIREYRTWIEVVDDNFYKEYALSRNGYINYIVSRTLVLRAYKDKGSYAKGMTWTIPEHMEKPRDFDPFGHAGLSPLVTI